ncbi:MFS transporter [Nocardioides sp. WS12]|uniref:MFS transporter n=1 Tax=Nocardioides sp. WS12 TaxID=2486272 RepID=UPI001EFFB5D4|nr:MFS transporter [Nocardioides sp. WS12]
MPADPLPSRWSVIAAYAFVAAATQLLWLNFAGVTTVSADHYGVSETAIGWLAQVFPLLFIALAIPAGALLDRWFRGGLLAGALLTAAGALVRVVGDDFGWVLAGQVLIAVAQPLVLTAITGVTSNYLAEKDRPTGIAIGTASTFFGMLAAFVLAFVYSEGAQLRNLVVVSAVIACTAAGVLATALRGTPPQLAADRRSDRPTVRSVWADPFVRRLCLLVTLPFGTFISLTTFAQPLLEPAGVSADAANLILMANVVAGIVAVRWCPCSRHVWARRWRS